MKAYWIAHVDVTDPDQYSQYTQRAPKAFALYGGRLLARGGRCEGLEGGPAAQRNVVIEFDSYEQALACYRSDEYQEAKRHREGVARAQIVIVEGVAPA
ncbi:DUF1330 domain-containing protein [Pseudomonas silesiensis]|jgi:uncharacterized protein (DUF1330 family)|uniref:DUF1330 domain-containing protein n=1 Tax=Pseudomonas silesiensis TaxID=1853130 RepID=A0A191YSD3_9PSED|nr:DUF1330 domain-containing protein [Pseudomonas silesiensis]ANJ55688.1 hypothetical protein PMA3_11225 [Pseudomonas silesiensis]VVO63113.1 hypothetical protein PS850_00918 [Pseudomonas fluorescens]VVP49003.1 hypothetical protein PS874_05126 [Pseudomonas fluorescens]